MSDSTIKPPAQPVEPKIEEQPPQKTEPEKPPQCSKHLYASGIPRGMTEFQFREIFKKFCCQGELLDCTLKKHVVGTQAGFAFITFSNPMDAMEAQRQLNGSYMLGEQIRVVESVPPKIKRSQTNLYLEGIPLDWKDKKLREVFSPIGKINKVQILINKRTWSTTGVGFVHFENPEDAQKAIDRFNGCVFEGSVKQLVVRHANATSQRRKPVHPMGHNEWQNYQSQGQSGWGVYFGKGLGYSPY